MGELCTGWFGVLWSMPGKRWVVRFRLTGASASTYLAPGCCACPDASGSLKANRGPLTGAEGELGAQAGLMAQAGPRVVDSEGRLKPGGRSSDSPPNAPPEDSSPPTPANANTLCVVGVRGRP